MKNIFKKIRVTYLLLTLVILLVISTGYFAYNNFKLNKIINLATSKNCNPANLEEAYFNISKYGTTTNWINCGAGNPNLNLNFVSMPNSLSVPVASTLYPFINNSFIGATTSIMNGEEQKKIEEMRDSIIGCYYMKDNINERVKLDRNNYFSKFVEGMNRFAQVNGSYVTSSDFKSIDFIPTEESKFSMKLYIGTSTVNLIDKNSDKVFEKETCADFYPNY